MSKDILFVRDIMKQEAAARIKHFNSEKERIYKNSKVDVNTFEKRIGEISKEQDEISKRLGEIKNELLKDSPLTINKYKRLDNVKEIIKQASAQFPDLADIRCFFCPMREVDMKHLELLYHDTDKLGRRKYLNARYDIPPEKKYCFRELTSWDYGWKIRDKNVRDKFFGRNSAINNYIWRNNGLAMFQKENQVPLTCGCPLVCKCSY